MMHQPRGVVGDGGMPRRVVLSCVVSRMPVGADAGAPVEDRHVKLPEIERRTHLQVAALPLTNPEWSRCYARRS